ncbi:lysM domain receptor-like kinase 3 [Macadamia integrifolia]|uniref:lysM domain receptor-like kinase 3 n=1 Tax=Macadamia integrifolia TaxID=60698 RepID=UPI001C4E7354|nr:lysM domain receptor-like kinase 3 [Macadamia integrifolia]
MPNVLLSVWGFNLTDHLFGQDSVVVDVRKTKCLLVHAAFGPMNAKLDRDKDHNNVRLIGYCIEGSLFLVYEFIENGKDLLPWFTMVQIALDSGRDLEYIHEHIVPVYIHRDIKSAKILIDKNHHGKVSDFGLAKFTEVGNSLKTRLVGTFGYMPPRIMDIEA